MWRGRLEGRRRGRRRRGSRRFRSCKHHGNEQHGKESSCIRGVLPASFTDCPCSLTEPDIWKVRARPRVRKLTSNASPQIQRSDWTISTELPMRVRIHCVLAIALSQHLIERYLRCAQTTSRRKAYKLQFGSFLLQPQPSHPTPHARSYAPMRTTLIDLRPPAQSRETSTSDARHAEDVSEEVVWAAEALGTCEADWGYARLTPASRLSSPVDVLEIDMTVLYFARANKFHAVKNEMFQLGVSLDQVSNFRSVEFEFWLSCKSAY